VKTKHIGLLIVVGVFDILANVAFSVASQSDLLSLVSVLSSLYPVVTLVMAWVFLKERLIAIQYAGILIALVGVCQIAIG
jgi:drug/metabolite transporter (DMT)-like permease